MYTVYVKHEDISSYSLGMRHPQALLHFLWSSQKPMTLMPKLQQVVAKPLSLGR